MERLGKLAFSGTAIALVTAFLACGCKGEPEQGAGGGPVGPGPRVSDAGSAPTVGDSVTIDAADGTELVCTIGKPEGDADPKGGVLLLHMLGRTRADWEALAEKLQAAGFATLAPDIRGHGESVKGPDGKLSYKDFGDADWQAAIDDVSAARDALVEATGVPADHIAIVGASIGANIAINAAAEDESIAGVVMVSPGLDYRGVTTVEATKAYTASKRPYCVIAAEDDPEAAKALEVLTGPDVNARNTNSSLTYDGGHGTDLLKSRPEQLDAIVEYVAYVLD